MKCGWLKRWLLAGMGAASMAVGAAELPEDLLAAHWHPATAEAARQHTLAALAWLEGDPASTAEFEQALDALALRIDESDRRIGPIEVSPADGLFGWLVQQRQANLAPAVTGFPDPEPQRIEALLVRDVGAGRIARLRVEAAYRAPAIWADVAERLGEQGRARLATHLAPLIEPLTAAAPESLEHARLQASRVQRWAGSTDEGERALIRDEIVRGEAARAWRNRRPLASVWFAFEGLLRLTQLGTDGRGPAGDWAAWFDALDANRVRNLREVDVELPVIVAMLRDAAGYLNAPEQANQLALEELGDVYARLALFAPDLGFYLEQPVRESVRRVLAGCSVDPLLIGPLPRDVFEDCARSLVELLSNGIEREEFVGQGNGPFDDEFLRRELGLVSWQRAAYLDGHLAWMLGASCQAVPWFNVLESALLSEHLVYWVTQRPVFFIGGDWLASLDGLLSRARELERARIEWVDCLTGQGRQRRDPLDRLLARHRGALVELSNLMSQAVDTFYTSVTRPGADIELDGSADQVTSYRPEALTVGPCPDADTCGARVELPVSRALVGLFPNAYLLADQIGLGRLGLCYENVRWVDREWRPARRPESRVADYFGRLAFDLVGTFDEGERNRIVFRHRLTDSERRHYLFAAADEELLGRACPIDRVGGSVASRLPEDHPGLVPNRLTYFASAPTTPEAELIANWDQGSEWRDWFVTGQRVEVLDAVDGETIRTEVRAELASLVARRERELTAPLVNPMPAGASDPLAVAMADAADTAALMRRVLEIHYPRIIRQMAPVRRHLAGESGLLTRERVRVLRDTGTPAVRMPAVGLARARAFETVWDGLDVRLREQGQRAPELDYALERLESMRRRIMAPAAEPGSTEAPVAPER
jgi:hypothetical protein